MKPKGILVIGSLAEVKGDPRFRRETFERFRQSVNGVEIITFDELHERAKFIVDHTSQSPKKDLGYAPQPSNGPDPS